MSNWLASSQVPVYPGNRHRISFPKILNESWYNKRRYLKVKTIQYRKEFHAPFRHEYLVVFLSDGSICRFDRRPDPNVPLDALRERGSEAYDTVEEITSSMLAGPSGEHSECLATLAFKDELDLFFIFLVCYGIQSDPQAVRYTLLQFNCYFFSWTIILNIARNSVTWEGLPTSASFKSLPKNVASEVSEILVRKLLGQSTAICNDLMHKILAQLAVLLPSRLFLRLPHLRKSLEQLPDLLRGAADSYSPISIVRWKFLKSKMSYSLEHALTNELFSRKLLRCMRKQIQFSGQLGYPLCIVLNNVLRRTLWRHSMNKVVRRATAKFLRDDEDEDDGLPSLHYNMWNVVAEILTREVILTFRENVLGLFTDLVCRVVASCVKQPKATDSLQTESTVDRIYRVAEDTIDACMSDVLEESLANAVWGSVKDKKEINGAIARAMGSVMADLLQDSHLPFALKVRNPRSIRDPLLLKSEIRWHIARWAQKTTTGADVQVSHSMLEQYFEYRIAAHSRGVRRFDAVAGHTIDTEKELHKAMHRVWEVVSGVPRTQGYEGY
ncbi:hypothetical protein FRC10_006711 [Ceratobasidium sp. 414]|nr:hypothetical protein FRC10_006711 [Ceratobasidium sp. 414]